MQCIKDSQAANLSVDELGNDLTMTLPVLVDTAVPSFCYLRSGILRSTVAGKQHS